MPIVMVTDDEDSIQQLGSETEGVYVISFKVRVLCRVFNVAANGTVQGYEVCLKECLRAFSELS